MTLALTLTLIQVAKLGSAMINALRGPHAAAVSAHLQPAQFHELLAGYARMHVRGAAEGVAAGEAFVGEVLITK